MRKTALLFFVIFAFAFTAFADPSFVYKLHAPLYVNGSNGLVQNKNLPKDNIRAFNFEEPVHVYMKIIVTAKGEKYTSEIIPYYNYPVYYNTYFSAPFGTTPFGMSGDNQDDINDYIERIVKINKIKKSTDVYVDIVLVSMDFETDSVRVELSDNDICIRNMKIPAEVKAFLESN